MKGIFLGCTAFSEELLKVLTTIEDFELAAIFSIPEEFSISYSKKKVKNSNYKDLRAIAESLEIPFIEIDSLPGKKLTDYSDLIKDLNPDVILVLGWYYMVPKPVRDLAKLGAWGIHASLLPKYAGGAPLVWAMINGEKETGITLFRLADGVDDGDIIAQRSFPIEYLDTIKEVYQRATHESKNILNDIFRNKDKITFTPQDKNKIEIYPQRKPEDGEIDLNWSGEKIYNFIRAQSPPYPGAFIKTKDGKKIIIEKASLIESE